MTNINYKNSHFTDLVKENEILKAQLLLEDKARDEWAWKWGFFLDFDKMCIEEAKGTIGEERFKQLTTFHKNTTKVRGPSWEIKPTKTFPVTSSGFVGWRSQLEFSLEKMGPLYISPRHTMLKHPPTHSIILG